MEGHSVSGESRKNGWVEQKKELTKVLKIAWPAVFESFFISLAGMIDVYMVSGLGSEAVASVGLTTQPKFLGLSLFFAMNVAIAAIVARRTGEKDKRRANETLAEAILLTILFGAVITVACVSLAGWLMEKCGSAPDTHDGAVIYFQIIMGGDQCCTERGRKHQNRDVYQHHIQHRQYYWKLSFDRRSSWLP